jgi:putative phosphoesterase
MRVALLSDTHAPRYWKRCPKDVADNLTDVDAILHAGDVCTPGVLYELEAYAPVYAVRGNNDGPDIAEWGAPDTLELELGGVRVAIVHDSGPADGRGPRLRSWFPDADLVVFGHSHMPWDETYQGQRAVNPGSPTDRRRQPSGTMGLLEIADGQIVDVRIFPVGAESSR